MTADFRALAAELVDELEAWIDGYLINDPSDQHTIAAQAMIERARAALAAQPVAPLVSDVDALASIIREVDGRHTLGAAALAEAILARYGSPQPVAVSERLPEPEDCDVQGWCWWFCPPDFMELRSHTAESAFVAGATHWLPANALPLPGVEAPP